MPYTIHGHAIVFAAVMGRTDNTLMIVVLLKTCYKVTLLLRSDRRVLFLTKTCNTTDKKRPTNSALHNTFF